MKNLILASLFILPLTIYSQQNNSAQNAYYLKKANTENKTGNILLVTGGVLILTGFVLVKDGNSNTRELISGTQVAGFLVATLGVASALSSIPFYIYAHQDRKKSFQLSPVIGTVQSFNLIGEDKNTAIGLKLDF